MLHTSSLITQITTDHLSFDKFINFVYIVTPPQSMLNNEANCDQQHLAACFGGVSFPTSGKSQLSFTSEQRGLKGSTVCLK